MHSERQIFKWLVCLLGLMCIDYLPVYAQQRDKTKISVLCESADANSKRQVELIVLRGNAVDTLDLEELLSESSDGNRWFYADSLVLRLWDMPGVEGLPKVHFERSMPSEALGSLIAERVRLGLGIKEVESHTGVMVTDVEPGSRAEKAGLQIGDVLLLIDDLSIESPAQVAAYVSTLGAEDPIEVVVLRLDQMLEIKIEAGRKPEVRKL